MVLVHHVATVMKRFRWIFVDTKCYNSDEDTFTSPDIPIRGKIINDT